MSENHVDVVIPLPVPVEDYIGPRIEELCSERNITTYRLSKLTGLTQTALGDVLKKKHVPTMHTLEKICEGLEISMGQFFSKDTESGALTVEEKEIIETWNKLAPEDRDIFLKVIRAFQ
ncbi:MAG: helix-turn-helix transcriptional regulator [Clostridiales bacterium]|nr:helix-turn-helix transcriptional regulator [Clostridiales bacterium]